MKLHDIKNDKKGGVFYVDSQQEIVIFTERKRDSKRRVVTCP